MQSQTDSEIFFRTYCRTNGIPCRRIHVATLPGERSPDFMIRASGHTVVVEVKELDESPFDRELRAELRRSGSTGAVDPRLDQRVRNKISKAMPQVRRLAKGRYPALIVLYNKASVFPIGGLEIRLAMYGRDHVDIGASGSPSSPIVWFRHRFGAGQKVAPTHNTTLSAVALLRDDNPQAIQLALFHNRHADPPLDPSWLRNPATSHHRLASSASAGGLVEWEQC